MSLHPQPLRRIVGHILEFTGRWFSERTSVPAPAPKHATCATQYDVNELRSVPEHLALRCELHDADRLLTSIPIIDPADVVEDELFLAAKVRSFPNSWNTVLACERIPPSSLIGDPPRLVVRCCPQCRVEARHFFDETRGLEAIAL